MSIKDQFISLAKMLESENEQAYNLWTWTASHHFTKKVHEDYADEFRPSNQDLMIEVCKTLSFLAGYTDDLVEEDRQWFMCTCEQCEFSKTPSLDEIKEFLQWRYKTEEDIKRKKQNREK